ncbi:MAG: hypothetical protein J2P18_04465 [Nocardia sp.]|nr:hypothetical protein [Nocardia sp.]
MDDIAADQAREALDAAARARRAVAAEVGLPRWYWWVMAAAWLVLGVLGGIGLWWLTTIATLLFGMAHSIYAARLLDGRRRTDRVQVSAAVAGRRTSLAVVVMLLALVGLTVAVAFAAQADGAEHCEIWAAVVVAAIVGFGGPEILRVLRGWFRA